MPVCDGLPDAMLVCVAADVAGVWVGVGWTVPELQAENKRIKRQQATGKTKRDRRFICITLSRYRDVRVE